MAIHRRCSTIIATILIPLALASCDGDNGRRIPVSPTTPTPPASPVLLRLELVVPGSIAPGESVQLTANAVKSDNTVENVTGQSQWTSSNPRVLEISSAGVAKGVANGEAFISARYQNRGASTRTFVLPTGTYRLSGIVTDTGIGVAGATVAVIGGVGEGLSAITSGDGSYVLYGVGGHVRLHAKANGYQNRILELDVGGHSAFNIDMVPDGPRRDLRGTYLLTVGLSGCGPPLTDVASTRSYNATVTQDGPRLAVALTGADFIVTGGRGNHFDGFIDRSDRISFAIGDVYYYYFYSGQYDLVERLSDMSALIVSGNVTAAPSSNGLSGTLNGTFMLTQGTAPPFTRIQARCYNPAHRFEMARR